MTPTDEQLAIIEAAARTRDSLLVNALAGAAKTTTLALAAGKMPPVPAICVAFNKRIAEEMAKRLPSFVTCSTMNSVGHRTWGQKLSKRLVVEQDKMYDILSQIQGKLRPEDRKTMGEAFASILRGTRSAKASGYIPEKFATVGKRLIGEDEFIAGFAAQSDVEIDDFFLSILDQALETSIAQAFEARIDFDDQVYMSALFGGVFPKYDTVMVDEAQDLSPLNHLILGKMVGSRIIAVGDPNQAIYAFRGADTSSMGKLKSQFNCRELSLNVSFRCPIKVVERAQARVPQMRYPEWAIEGKVERLDHWGVDNVPDGAVVLCRNNAPLLRAALRFIRQGRSVKVHGADIGKSLVKIMRELGPKTTPQKEAIELLKDWRNAQLEKAHQSRKQAIHDRYECILVFFEESGTIEEAITRAEFIFASAGKVEFMTGHKAKGGEWDTVFHLDPFLIPSKFAREASEAGDDSQMNQELNLRYVIETRPKKELFLVCTEDFR